MAAERKALFDKQKLALAGARFRAWWDGAAFDEDAAKAAIEAKLAAANDRTEGADDALFDEPPYDFPPRLAALALLWGQDRIRPGAAAAEQAALAQMGLAADGALAVIGPGAAGPLVTIAAAHAGKIDAFEWREETLEALKYGAARAKLGERVSVARFDLESGAPLPSLYDGVLCIDDFTYCSHPPTLAQRMIKGLKPGGCAIVETYAGLPSPAFATAFATAFSEPHVRAHGDVLQFFTDAGFALETDEDLTDECLGRAREGFKLLGERLAEAGDLDVIAARELAWEAEAWRARMKLLAQRRLERRRFVLRKAAE
jgi:SAM-dependent methyltransferase